MYQAGVVNILTGKPSELASIFANHMDVNAVIYCENDTKTQASIKEQAAENVKRVHFYAGRTGIRKMDNHLISSWIRKK